MQFYFNRKELLNALAIGGSFAGKNRAMAVLEMCKMRIHDDGRMFVSSTDLESFVTKRVFSEGVSGISTRKEIEFAMHIDTLNKVLRTLSCDSVCLDIDDDCREMVVRYKKGSMKMPLHDASEYPTPARVNDGVTMDTDATMLKRWFDVSKSFYSNDNLRPILNGMYLYMKDGVLGCCATDGQKLFHDETSNSSDADMQADCVISSSCFSTISALLNGYSAVSISMDKVNATFRVDDASVVCRLVNGNYPNFRAVLPKEHPMSFTTNRSELIETITRCGIASGASRCLRIDANPMDVTLVAEDIDFGKTSSETINVEDSNVQIEIGVNADSLLTTLNAIDGENVTIKFKDARSPIDVYETYDSSKRIITMPMMIS